MFTVIAFSSAVPGYALLSSAACVLSAPDSFFVPQPVNIDTVIAKTSITASNFLNFINIFSSFLLHKKEVYLKYTSLVYILYHYNNTKLWNSQDMNLIKRGQINALL